MSTPRALLGIGFLALALGAAIPLRAEAGAADDAAKTAREAARADRHAESIDAFLRAIELSPKRRREWLPELADQLTWSGRLDEAIELYREASESDDPAEQRRARIGLARALSWDDDQSAALAEYQAVLRDHPDDLEARRGVGRVQSWRGRHREAASRMRELLEDHPHDREATAILAESLTWMGRPDRAERVLREQLANDPADEGASARLEDIDFYQRPEARIDWRESRQSDDLGISLVSLDSRLQLAEGRSFVGARYELGVYRPDEGPVKDIRVQRPGLQAGYRLSDSLDWHGSFFVDVIDTRGASGDHERATYETYLTFWPSDLLRFDVGSSRHTFDSEEALREGLTATHGNASVDLLPNELTRLTARMSLGDYSDGNTRTWWQLEGERRIWQHPRVALGYRYTGFDFSEPEQGGYYNPDLYHSNEVLLRASGRFSDGVRWDLASSGGHEIEKSGDSRLIWNAGASVAWAIARRLELEVSYAYTSSSTASTGGFERGTGRVALRYAF